MYSGVVILALAASASAYILKRESVMVDKRQALTNISSWDCNKPIPYFFETPSDTELVNAMRDAAKFWNDNTCLNIVENGPGNDRIKISSRGACSAVLGRVGGEQGMWMGNGCRDFSTSTHELAHSLGIMHEMSRYDRDQHVRVNWAGLNGGQGNHNYRLAPKADSSNFGVPFEYGSNMAYPEFNNWIANYNGPQITALDKDYQHSLRGWGPSFYNVLLVNKYLKCYDKCNNHNQCKNKGYMHPRGCNKCICPEGWGGQYCDQKPEGCVVELKATSNSQRHYINLESTGKFRGDRCIYLITADNPNQKVEITFSSYYGGWFQDGCKKGGLELKTKSDAQARGIRFCGDSMKERTTFKSETNRLPIIGYSYGSPVTADISYRAVQ